LSQIGYRFLIVLKNPMKTTRRELLKRSSIAIGGTVAMPLYQQGFQGSAGIDVHPEDNSMVFDLKTKDLISVALDEAKKAGADYADVRLTHTWNRFFFNNVRNIRDTESI